MKRNGTDKALTPRQAKAIEAMMSEPTIRGAAKKAGVGITTVYRWLDDADFSTALREARARAFESLLTELQALGRLAVDTLREVMENPEAHPGSRVKAALGALASIIKSREVLENEDRLRIIESQLQAIEAERRASSTWTN